MREKDNAENGEIERGGREGPATPKAEAAAASPSPPCCQYGAGVHGERCGTTLGRGECGAGGAGVAWAPGWTRAFGRTPGKPRRRWARVAVDVDCSRDTDSGRIPIVVETRTRGGVKTGGGEKE